MKCLAFVDIHGNKKLFELLKDKIKKENPEVIFCAGDFTTFERDIKQWMHRFSRLGKQFFLVHGNHEEERVVNQIANYYKNIHFVHQKIIEYKDMVVIGWGGGGFTIRDVLFEAWTKEIRQELFAYKREGKKIVLLSHSPFYKTKLDFLDDHHGNKSMRNFIKRFDVDVGICGHFHENFGKEDVIGKCRVFNPGPLGKIIEI